MKKMNPMELFVSTVTERVTARVTATSEKAKKLTRRVTADLTMVVVHVNLTAPNSDDRDSFQEQNKAGKAMSAKNCPREPKEQRSTW